MNSALMFQTNSLNIGGRGIIKPQPEEKKFKFFCRRIQVSNKIRELNCRRNKMEQKLDQLMYSDHQLDQNAANENE